MPVVSVQPSGVSEQEGGGVWGTRPSTSLASCTAQKQACPWNPRPSEKALSSPDQALPFAAGSGGALAACFSGTAGSCPSSPEYGTCRCHILLLACSPVSTQSFLKASMTYSPLNPLHDTLSQALVGPKEVSEQGQPSPARSLFLLVTGCFQNTTAQTQKGESSKRRACPLPLTVRQSGSFPRETMGCPRPGDRKDRLWLSFSDYSEQPTVVS